MADQKKGGGGMPWWATPLLIFLGAYIALGVLAPDICTKTGLLCHIRSADAGRGYGAGDTAYVPPSGAGNRRSQADPIRIPQQRPPGGYRCEHQGMTGWCVD